MEILVLIVWFSHLCLAKMLSTQAVFLLGRMGGGGGGGQHVLSVPMCHPVHSFYTNTWRVKQFVSQKGPTLILQTSTWKWDGKEANVVQNLQIGVAHALGILTIFTGMWRVFGIAFAAHFCSQLKLVVVKVPLHLKTSLIFLRIIHTVLLPTFSVPLQVLLLISPKGN